jgi:hypothetical protein
MKQVNMISLIVMAAAALFTWNAVALPMHDVHAKKYHVMDNLSPAESKTARDLLAARGYQLSGKELFTESNRAVLITKTIPIDNELPSIQIEIVQMNSAKDIPHTTFTTTIPSSQISEAIQLLPNPNDSATSELMPVAYQN